MRFKLNNPRHAIIFKTIKPMSSYTYINILLNKNQPQCMDNYLQSSLKFITKGHAQHPMRKVHKSYCEIN